MPEARPVIDLQDISYAPEGRPALVDLTLRTDHRRIGIVGRNGSGKTSLARVLCGLVAPDSGTVRIDGIDVLKDRKAALNTVGILFQNPDHQIIFPTVEEEIAFGLKQMKLPPEQVAAQVSGILERFGKAHWAKAVVHSLSQGQRHLVCLMAVLVMSPRVLILDEPFSGLDIPTTRQLQRTLASLPLTIVHITHDPPIVQTYDQGVWLEGGRVERIGPAAPVLAAFTERMISMGDGDDLSDLTG
jgi:biotin transport system ATP-binding protein